MTTRQAKGSFTVKMDPEPTLDSANGGTLRRFRLAKEFTGDLEATSEGVMVSAMTEVKGSAGYVAMERVKGSLDGRQGTFVMQHSGTMNRGRASLTVSVVPDSGTDELAGLAGHMTIEIVDGAHGYTLDYAIATPG